MDLSSDPEIINLLSGVTATETISPKNLIYNRYKSENLCEHHQNGELVAWLEDQTL